MKKTIMDCLEKTKKEKKLDNEMVDILINELKKNNCSEITSLSGKIINLIRERYVKNKKNKD